MVLVWILIFFFFFFQTRTVVSNGQNRHGFYRDSANEDRQIDGGYAEYHILYFQLVQKKYIVKRRRFVRKKEMRIKKKK